MSDFDDREQAAYERVVRLLGSVDGGLVVGDGTWTARDVLAHLCTVARRYTSVPRLGETVREVDAIKLAALDGLSVSELLGKFERAFARYRDVWTAMGPEHMWPFHGGGQLPTAALRANWLGEMVVHGYDVARAAGVDWPIPSPDAADLLMLLRGIAPTYARAGERVAVEFAADGAERWVLVVAPEGARVEPGVSADAVVGGAGAAVVLLMYQRIDLETAERAGLSVSGDRSAVVRLLAQLERP
jgi:uncharacterized protein (TIGR03083 family)